MRKIRFRSSFKERSIVKSGHIAQALIPTTRLSEELGSATK